MEKIAYFERVNFENFKEAIKAAFELDETITDDIIKEMYDNIQLPERATVGSAGYDFKSYFSFSLKPGETIAIPTGIRVHIDDGWFLGIVPRSSYGFKYRVQLDNTIGIIDSDFYYSNTEGHILIKLTNDNNFGDILNVATHDKIVQGIFIPYGITFDDAVTATRKGGIGSTGN